MRTFTLSFLFILACATVSAQNGEITLRFSASYNDAFVELDSVLIENMSREGSAVLHYPDTVLKLVTTYSELIPDRAGDLHVSQNYPNPFSDMTNVDIYVPERDIFRISVYDLSGRLVANYSNTLEPGMHQFTFYACDQQTYLLAVSSNRYREQRIMLQTGGSRSSARLVYNGTDVLSGTELKSLNLKSGSAGLPYEDGDRLRFTGYITDAGGNVDYRVLTDVPVSDTDYIFHIAEMFYFVIETMTGQTEFRFVADDASGLVVDWGDGNSDTFNGNVEPSHNYGEEGMWTVKVRGEATRISFSTGWSCNYAPMLRDILTPVASGVKGITSSYRMFRNTEVERFSCVDFFDETSSGVTNMGEMFANSMFNQDLGGWNVGNVRSMWGMFRETDFDQDIGDWDVSNVTNMSSIFRDTYFNRDIGNWDVGNVTNMSSMFMYSGFNQDIGTWNVGKVESMEGMFEDSPFNRDIGDWDVSSVTSMENMFRDTPFDRDISRWDVSNVTNFSQFLMGGGLSAEYYSNILVMWSHLDLEEYVNFDGGASRYGQGLPEERRQFIIDNFNWTFNDGGTTGEEFGGVHVNVVASPPKAGIVAGSGIYDEGDEVQISASAKPVYRFSGWETTAGNLEDAGAAETIFTVPDESVTVTALFEEDPEGDNVFVFVIETTEELTEYRFALEGANDLYVYWKEGSVEIYNGDTEPVYDFGEAGEWTIRVAGEAERLSFSLSGAQGCMYAEMLRDILTPVSEGVNGISSAREMFANIQVERFTCEEFFDGVSGSVTDMASMFRYSQFNQDIGNWDVSSVASMYEMFMDSPFNQDISGWDVSSVTSMGSMFRGTSFDQDISQWDVSSVTNMSYMFRDTPFDQDISQWDVSNVTGFYHFLFGSELSAVNYNKLLIEWSNLDLRENVTLFAGSSRYDRGEPEERRQYIIDEFNWTIYDGGYERYKLGMVSSPEGGGTFEGMGDYYAGAEVTVSATANPFFSFSGWAIPEAGAFDDETSAETTFTMPAGDVTLVANFDEDSIEEGYFYFYIETTDENTSYKFAADGAVDLLVEWDDENSDVYNGDVKPEHDYGEAGEWIIRVKGEASRIALSGDVNQRFYARMLRGLTPVGEGVTGITSTVRMLAYTEVDRFWRSDFLDGVVENITDMSYMFENSDFNRDIGDWDVSNVTNMAGMFQETPFNRDIGEWDVGSVTNMSFMFHRTPFNQDIGDWDVSNVTNMSCMFQDSHFSQDIGGWDVSNVTNMRNMFQDSPFNHDIGGWDVSGVTNFSYMFHDSDFNRDIGGWNVSSSRTMRNMFSHSEFDRDIGYWDVSNVLSMAGMFSNSGFNHDIGGWDVGNVTDMNSMFSDTPFDQDIGGWDVSNVSDFRNFLSGSGLSADNYNSLIIMWSYLDLTADLNFNAGDSRYDLGLPQERREYLVNELNWSITDGGDTGEEFPYINLRLVTNPQGAGIVEGGGNYQAGAEVVISAQPHPFYTFAGWDAPEGEFEDAGSAETVFTIPAEHVIITANFEENPEEKAFEFVVETTAGTTDYSFRLDDADNLFVFWEQGSVEKYKGNVVASHDFGEAGEWTVKVRGTASRIAFSETGYRDMLKDILSPVSDGLSGITNASSMFLGTAVESFSCDDFLDDISGSITDMSYMFSGSSFNQDISGWDVSNVVSMDDMFGYSAFDQDIGDWEVGNVKNMRSMFRNSVFNQDIGDWDVGNVTDMGSMFRNSEFNGDISGWDVSKVTIMSYMFSESVFNQDISDWDVANVVNMMEMFRNSAFNSDISDWDVSNVANMNMMFNNSVFNQEIGDWNVGNVTNMSGMFTSSDFNQDIGDWDVGKVTHMNSMFRESAFNNDIGSWDVGSVTNMNAMFQGSDFNSDISGWDVSSVTNMGSMFQGSSFNQDISGWDVSSVTNMRTMFNRSSFNQPIGGWDVGNVADMSYMFSESDFNQDIGDWNVGNVTTMVGMFRSSSFNQPIGGWNVENVTDMGATGTHIGGGTWAWSHGMFQDSSFDQDISDWNVSNVGNFQRFLDGAGLSSDNYNKLLIKWSDLQLKNNITFDAGSSKYDLGLPQQRRDNIISAFGWTINDAGDTGEEYLSENLVLVVNPEGAGDVASDGEYHEGGEVTLTATANEGWEFVNWTGADELEVSDQPSFVYTMPGEEVVLTANFDRKSFSFVIQTTVENSDYKFLVDDAVAFEVDWGDGNSGTYNGTDYPEHDYGEEGEWVIRVRGEASRIAFFTGFFEEEDYAYARMLKDILTPVSDGVTGITSARRMFMFTEVESFSCEYFFDETSSKVTDMYQMFYESSFNQDINDWNVSSVKDMRWMFCFSSFNGNISSWDVSIVTDMGWMFHQAPFNQDIGGWDVGNVTDMRSMFRESEFNQDISNWDVSKVEDMEWIFAGTSFNQDIGNWDVSNVENMTGMFNLNNAFDQEIGGWDVRNVTGMSGMFRYSSFNKDISGWDVGKVREMMGMFSESQFNQDIGGWDVSSTYNLSYMFRESPFDQDISGWDVSGVTTFVSFLEGSQISVDNYNKLLIEWSYLALQHDVVFDAGSSKYDLGLPEERRQHIIDSFGWTINDGGDTGEEYVE